MSPGKSRGSSIKITGILWGILISLSLLAAGSLLLGILINFTSISIHLPTNLLFILNYVAVFIGGIVAAYYVGTNGWLNGALVGFIYMLVIIMLGSLWHSITFSLGLILKVATAFLVSGLGGMIGVNIV